MPRWGVEWTNYDFNAVRCLLLARMAYTFDTLFHFFSFVLLLINFLLPFQHFARLCLSSVSAWGAMLAETNCDDDTTAAGGTLSLATTWASI